MDIAAGFEQIKSNLIDYYQTGARMAQAYISGGPEAGNRLMPEFAAYATRLNSALEEIIIQHKEELSTSIARLRAAFFTAGLIAIIVSASSALLGIILALLVANSISKPIRLIAQATDRIATGDLTREVEYFRASELG